jgi:hypothetical protein
MVEGRPTSMKVVFVEPTPPNSAGAPEWSYELKPDGDTAISQSRQAGAASCCPAIAKD